MKRLTALLTALVMALTMTAATALAEGDNVLQQIVDDCDRLLFQLDNVTLQGGMELSYEGQWFKTVEGIYQQEGFRSCWDLKVESPEKNGGILRSGYTIYGDSDRVYVDEVLDPGVIKTVYGNDEHDTVMRDSIQTRMLMELIRTVAALAPSFLGEQGMTVADDGNGGQVITLKLDETVPDIVDIALTMMLRFAGKRYFSMDEDEVSMDLTSSIQDYMTIARGIVCATISVKMQSADVVIRLNEKGELVSVSGKAALKLQTARDGERLLETNFHLEVSDRGTTKARQFNR